MARQVSKKRTKPLTKGAKKTVSATNVYNQAAKVTSLLTPLDVRKTVSGGGGSWEPDARDATEASSILDDAAGHLRARAALRDQPDGERSMARAVHAFNALFRRDLTEREGWMFMVFLKAARATNTQTGILDDYQDGTAYFALAGEAALKQSEG